MNAFLNITGMFLMAWKSEPPMAAPSVPPNTISMAGMLMHGHHVGALHRRAEGDEQAAGDDADQR